MNLVLLFLSVVLVNNVITSQFMGICPFLGVSKKVDTSVGMGIAVTFVLTLASFITYFVQKLLEITNNQFLQTIAFILVIASIVQFVEMVIQKMSGTSGLHEQNTWKAFHLPDLREAPLGHHHPLLLDS